MNGRGTGKRVWSKISPYGTLNEFLAFSPLSISMVIRRAFSLSFLWVLLGSVLIATAPLFGFQILQKKSTPASATKALPKASTTSKLPPAKFHTPVSSHIRTRNRSALNSLRQKHFGRSVSNSIIRSQKTTISGNSGSVSLSVKIGRAAVTTVKATVASAPQGMKFFRLSWVSLRNGLPSGVTLMPNTRTDVECPTLQFTFAVPENAENITPVIQSAISNSVGTIHLLPNLSLEKKSSPRTYSASAVLPSVSITRPHTFRSLRIVTVTVPLASRQGDNILTLDKFTVGINFTVHGQVTANPALTRDPVFATLNRHLVVNGSDLPNFAVPLRSQQKFLNSKFSTTKIQSLPPVLDSIVNWIDTSAPYIRLAITRDGLYRVSASDLNFTTQNFSLATSGWTAKTLRCYNRGTEIPIWIDTDASGAIAGIEFYGEHLHGFPLPTVKFPYTTSYDADKPRAEYYNVATDTNVYWLTASSYGSGNNLPLRYVLRSIVPTSLPVINSGTVLLHHEREKNYFLGDIWTDESLYQEMTEYVPGERFEWAELHGTDDFGAIGNPSLTQFFDTIFIPKLPSDTAGKVANFKFFLHGMTNESGGNGHSVRVGVNGFQNLPTNFTGYNDDSLLISVPISQLKTGANIVNVQALTTGDSIDQFYLDYYEATFDEALAPSTDTGIQKGQWHFTLKPSSLKYQIALSDNSAHLFNITNRTRIDLVSGIFSDSTNTQNPEYTAATSNTLLHCDNVQAWNTGVGGSWEILKPSNRADYLVITHPNFLRSAQMLATMRATAGLQTKVITTDEIFNAFNFGSNEPEGIRRYLTYAYNEYSGVPVSFVTLLGNASWDPKFNLPGSKFPSLVPSYGWPVSDYYYTIPDGESLDSTSLMLIARIPVLTENDAEAYIAKLQEYENAIPTPWNQHGLFLAGGDPGQQHAEIDTDIRSPDRNGFVPQMEAPPLDMTDTIIDRTDFSTGVDATHVGAIQDLLDRGQSLMYFSGHGATFTSDIAFPDASVLNNKGLYPLLVTLTCRTGAFAEPNQVTVNESYIQVPEAGSSQAYGTTGFGDLDYDNLFTDTWIDLMRSFDSTHDTTKSESINMLQLLTAAKIHEQMFSGSEASVSHNETLQNSMLGDAAIGFALKPQPEFAVYSKEIHGYSPTDTIPKISFSLADSGIKIGALIHNYGYAAERSVIIEIIDAGPGGTVTKFDTLSSLFDSAYISALFGLNVQSVGTHLITVVIDPGHKFPEETAFRSDDSASITIVVNGLSTTAFYPYEGSRGMCDISQSSVHFIVLTPSGSNPNDMVEIELDTSSAFSNILTDKKSAVGTSYFVTFDLTLPPTPVPVSSVYWWRTRVIKSTGDTTSWQPATFSTASASRSEFSYSTPQQLFATIENGLSLDAQGRLYLPTLDTLRFDAHSLSLLDSEVTGTEGDVPYAQVFVNGKFYWQDSAFQHPLYYSDNGFIILVWTPDGTQIDYADEFEMPWQLIGDQPFEDSMANVFDSVIQAIPNGRFVMVLTVGSVDFGQYFFPKTDTQMQSLGSLNGMSGMSYDGSYALIGVKGSAPGSARETFLSGGLGGAHAYDTTIRPGTSGISETPYTAVAKDYGSLTWTGNPITTGEDIRFTVLGSRRDGTGVDIVDTFAASEGNSFSLSNVDPRTYDRLAVRMNFIRTTSATASPALSEVALQYDPAPEFTFSGDSIRCVPKITNAGGTIIASYSPETLTCTPGDSVEVMIVRQSQGIVDTPVVHYISIGGHSSKQILDTLGTINELGPISLLGIVNPNEAQNEQLLVNNTISGTYMVVRDTMAPTAQILFSDPTDKIDQHVSDCGYASSNSTIKIQLISSNPLRDTSSSSISAQFIYINNSGQPVQVGVGNPNGFQVQFQTFPSGLLQAQLIITPTTPFLPGQWLMKAFVRDASGNTDTESQCFTISNVNGVEEVMNYPNPFKQTTDFTFILRSDAPADLKIVVYTIAGRKIRTLTPPALHAGFNAIPWDGRDEHGNEVANGTYLYRVVLTGKDGDNVSEAVSEPAVKAR